ncbi:MAG: DUF4301 family protein [Paludibacteraceae bacterium]|jgi:hypothetical protein|nr:DUF4301 family protein [Paludibacteraceae bacterium]HHT61028.1 DUF4301 family protein [Bacteroidales bacterium]MBP9038978.1 DUF4301 family protein [Paludibacteraceae bacterium]HOG35925.1 DUF4301 family protein [Paludibacteraceae bacterium]HOO23521.1 DUF4301 family protein [Paludibacteraceae bacterium]
MFTPADLQQLASKGISIAQAEEQLNYFKQGFPQLEIKQAANVGNGISRLSDEEQEKYIDLWEKYLDSDNTIVKFVPASGAASRMFKNLFEFLNGNQELPNTEFMLSFFHQIAKFSFYNELNDACKKNEGASIEKLMADKNYKAIVSNLLEEKGLNYGTLPKGLLNFHTYVEEVRTPFLEHLVEGALYANNKKNEVNIHFTVSGEHKELFKKHLMDNLSSYTEKFGVKFNISFSEQKPSTDTLAVDKNNVPFRTAEGKLLFRPGGHGALIHNLNDIEADVVFIKNIDNVVPDRLKNSTITYKKIIGGFLVALQQQTFAYLKELENEQISDSKLMIIKQFCEARLNNIQPNEPKNRNELIDYLKQKLNRPIRVCGMVKNEGEPGGGPFLTVNADGTISPQILESSQIKDQNIMTQSTHFNPVDLVCAIKDYRGNHFNLLSYVDKQTGFISSKSYDGKELKALELPGLWNGAMSDWNTVFVEVPSDTFNPVKTVNDLLREEHQ